MRVVVLVFFFKLFYGAFHKWSEKYTSDKKASMILSHADFQPLKKKTFADISHCHMTVFNVFHDFFPGRCLFLSDVFPSQEF